VLTPAGVASSEYYDAYWDERRALTGLYPELRDLLARSIRGDARCLDVGCGDGRTAGLFLSEHAGGYTGVDVSRTAVHRARHQGLDARLIEDPAELPFADGSFDAVACLEVLEHLVAPLSTAQELHRVLRPGGVILVTVPNIVYWRRRLDYALIGRWNPLGDALSVPEPWRDPHLRFFTLKALRRMIERAGFEVVSAGGHWGGFLVDLPGVQRLGILGGEADVTRVRRSSRQYRRLERLLPSLLAFRLHLVAEARSIQQPGL
jgi:SAM-dependent methyltransferase